MRRKGNVAMTIVAVIGLVAVAMMIWMLTVHTDWQKAGDSEAATPTPEATSTPRGRGGRSYSVAPVGTPTPVPAQTPATDETEQPEPTEEPAPSPTPAPETVEDPAEPAEEQPAAISLLDMILSRIPAGADNVLPADDETPEDDNEALADDEMPEDDAGTPVNDPSRGGFIEVIMAYLPDLEAEEADPGADERAAQLSSGPVAVSISLSDYQVRMLTGTTVEIIAYIGSQTYVEIPSVINGMTVTGIGPHAFEGNTDIVSVSIRGNALTAIGNYAFSGCTSLREVRRRGGSIETVGEHAFDGCTALEHVELRLAKTIGAYAFYGCEALERIVTNTDERTIASVGDHAFDGCVSLRELHFGSLLRDIGEEPFANCTRRLCVYCGQNIALIRYCQTNRINYRGEIPQATPVPAEPDEPVDEPSADEP